MNLIPTREGWFVEANGERVGPFPHRGAAVDWMLEHERAREHEARQQAAKERAEALSDSGLARALEEAIRHPPKSPRGRGVPDHPREADIAFEYYWRIRPRRNRARAITAVAKARAVAAVAKEFGCTADHVRKVRAEYTPVAKYDNDLLEQLRADAVQRRTRKPEAIPKAPKPMTHESAQQWLRSLLKPGSAPARDVYRRAAVAGFSRRTIERAKVSLGIVSARGGRNSKWQLPTVPNSAKRRI